MTFHRNQPDRGELRDDRMTGVIAAALGVLVAIGVVLLILSLNDDGGGGAATTTTAATTTVAPTTTTATSTTTGSSTTAATTTTPTTTTTTTTTTAPTTTAAPFTGDLADKNCPGSGFPNAGRVIDVRIGEHVGFTRVVFDFEGEVPDCFVETWIGDPNRISVLVWGTSGPAAGLVGPGGVIATVSTGSVTLIRSEGMGGGSGEWVFSITTSTPNRPFSIFTLASPSRLAIDIGD